MRHMRRWTALLGLSVGVLALSAFLLERLAEPAQAQKIIQPGFQPNPPGQSNGGQAAGLSSVVIIEDSKARQAIEVGRDCIKDSEWGQAIKPLQAILERNEDYFVQVSETDATGRRTTQRWTSAKFEANNLIGSMPAAGLETYEVTVGGKAKTMLDDAKKEGDRAQLAVVAQRYCHSLAGIEANEILATLYLARGQVFTAALRFEKLLQMNPERAKLNDLTIFKAALAFHRAGDTKNFDLAWARLEKKLDGAGLKVGAEVVPFAKLKDVIKESPSIDDVNVHDWLNWRGNNRNSAQANGSPPLLDDTLFRRKYLRDKLDDLPEDNDQAAETRIAAAVKQVADANDPVMPGFFPICSQGIMVFRSHRDVRAVALKPLKIKYDDDRVFSFKAGEIIWKSMDLNRSLSVLLSKNDTRTRFEGWLDNYNQVSGYNSFLYDNTVLGTLSTDHRLVFAINDLAVPVHPNVFSQIGFNNPQYNVNGMKHLMVQNQLLAFDLFSGRLKWELNSDESKSEDADFKNSHFLSLPISVGGKLYVLNERMLNTNGGANPNPFGGRMNPFPGDSELRLVCIDPTKTNGPRPAIVEPIQVLGTVRQSHRYVQDVSRRANAVQLAFGDGVLVCPTNAGEVFGIDVMTRSLVWSYPYRENSPQQVFLPGQFNPRPGFPVNPIKRNFGKPQISKWKSSPPVIADGKIVFTAPDADSVHCISLRDGKPLWRKGQQKGDLFLAGVFKGKALIVGESGIRALDLKDGSLRWSAATGDLPSGQGVASKDIYYLPLRRGEILAVDVVTGQVKARNRSNAGAAPGNLVFYDGMVLTQTPTEVIAYPQLSLRLASAKANAGADPKNLAKLTDYAVLLLKDGQVKLAAENLMQVYNSNPAEPLAKQVKDRLFEAITDLMHVDFTFAAKEYLTVYKALCAVPNNPAEEQARKAKFYRLVGEGREAQRNLVEAFQMYKEFGALPMHRDKGVPSTEDPNQKIPVNIWLRGRISAMLANAPAAQREPLEAKIAEEWKAVEAKKDMDAIRSFVGMFDTPFRVGREARVRLAEAIMEKNELASLLEAELSLLQVLDSDFAGEPELAGRALAALAKLEEKKGTADSLRLAASYYQRLSVDFAAVKVRGNKTGADLLNELATDKRFLPFLGQSGGSWGPVKMTVRTIGAGVVPVGPSAFVMRPLGDRTPFALQNRLVFSMSHPKYVGQPVLSLRDLATSRERWVIPVGQRFGVEYNMLSQLYQQSNSNQKYYADARHRFYHVKGHLIVCQVGAMVYCLDGDTGKKLWETRIVESFANNGFVNLQRTEFDRDGNPEFVYRNNQNGQYFRVALGRIGAVQASYVAIVGPDGVVVHDPLRGGVIWKKSDVSTTSHVFGDDRHVFIAEANENGTIGAGRTLRAIDGELVAGKDFGNVYQTRLHVMGRKILSAQAGAGNLVVRLYDIVTGKDVWSKAFAPGAYALRTEDPSFVGVLDNKGGLTVLASADGKELVNTNIIQGRITGQDLVNLQDPLLLADRDRFYIALNRAIDKGQVADITVYSNGVNRQQSSLNNNFNEGTRCAIANGWFVAVHRHDGTRKAGDRQLTWKKGDVAWHSYMPIQNQMLVLEQFSQSPVVLFSARYYKVLANGGRQWVSITQSFSKTSGKMIYDSGAEPTNGVSPLFSRFLVDPKTRTVNLIGNFGARTIQHYVDDGKGAPPAVPGGVMNNPGGYYPPVIVGGPANPQFPPPIGIRPPIVRRPPPVRILPNRPIELPQKR